MNPSTTLFIAADWQAELEAAARRPLKQRWRDAFIKTHQPVLDDARFRSFAPPVATAQDRTQVSHDDTQGRTV